MIEAMKRIKGSVAFYPVTLSYLAACLTVVAVVAEVFRPDVALTLLALACVLIVVLSMRREVSTVHHLVNSQHDALVDKIGKMAVRIDQLLDTLIDAGVKIPADKSGADRERQHG